MMQKKDLAKEFSLLVQQEIKNHNDSILATNMSLEEFRNRLDSLKEKTEKDIAALSSALLANTSEIKEVDQSVNDILSDFLRRINDCNSSNLNQIIALKKSMDTRESYFLTIDGFNHFESKFDQWIANLKLSFSHQKDQFFEEIRRISDKFNQNLQEFRAETQNKFFKVEESQKGVSQELDTFAINFSGFVREIEFAKKRSFIIEKNIENLYTQIERLKEGNLCHKQV